MALPEGLLDAVRNYLDITWEDSAGDAKLSGIIARGIKYIDSVAGVPQDYTVEDKPRELLLDYCRYVRSNALDEFQTNYLHELLSLQIREEGRRMPKTTQSFNDGVVNIYSVSDTSVDGGMPTETLTLKQTLRYHERTVGLTRFYTAKQANVEVKYVLRCPRLRYVSRRMWRSPMTESSTA
jgi:hypothetical protein